jgi:integrase
MAAKLEKTATPGVYRRHRGACRRGRACGCPYVVVAYHKGKQVKTFHPTFELAREAKGDRSGSVRQAPQSRRPFDEYARRWVSSCQGRTARGFDEDTRKSYARALELYAIPHFGRMLLRDIERKDVNALISKLQRQGLSAASIEKYVAPIRALFADAVDEDDLVSNPAVNLRINRKATRPGEPAKPERVKLMTGVELTAVIAEIPERHRLLFEVMAGTGCRISEVLGFDTVDVEQHGDHTTLRIERQFYRGTLKPNAKTEAGARTVECSPELAAKLWERCADATGPMFATRTGKRLSDRNLARVLDAAAERAGVPGVSHHVFRHTHGSMLLDRGWTIAEVAERLGHANPAITAQVYSHKMRDRRRDLSFLDGLGNDRAMSHPDTAGNGERAASMETATLRGEAEQRQAAANGALSL